MDKKRVGEIDKSIAVFTILNRISSVEGYQLFLMDLNAPFCVDRNTIDDI